MALGFITPGTRHRFKREVNTGAYNPADVGSLYGWGSSVEFALEGENSATPLARGEASALWRKVAVGHSVASTTNGGGSGGVLLPRQSVLFVAADGTLWAVGYNLDYQLGLGDNATKETITQVGTDADWNSVVTAGYRSASALSYTLVLKNNGTLWVVGDNSNGQLGLGDNDLRQNLVQVGSETGWSTIAVGGLMGGAIKGGQLMLTGRNAEGSLSTGGTTNLNVFTAALREASPGSGASGALTDSDWAWVDFGVAREREATFAIKTGGTLWSCGRNELGVLGHGDTTDRTVLAQVGVAADWLRVRATKKLNGSTSDSYISWLGIKTDGTLWACGWNANGELGLGDTTTRDEPVQVGSDTDWIDAWPGDTSYALKSNGRLYSAGSAPSSDTFVQFGSDEDWFAIAAEGNVQYGIRQIGEA